MFIDRDYALMLGEGELRRDLHYRARFYSYANKDAFLTYLSRPASLSSTHGVAFQE